MLDREACAAALSVERKMYLALSEVLDLTGELSDAFGRQDQVAVRMFLNMRQEQVNLLREYRRMLRRQCRALPPEAGDALRKVLSGESSPEPDAADLCRQVASNRQLLERTLQADRALSVRLGGEHSFYRRKTAERTTE